MRVLQVNDTDLRGRRFSGYDLLSDLTTRGIIGTQAVLAKHSDDPKVVSLWSEPTDAALNEAIAGVELAHGMQGLLYPWARTLRDSAAIRDADVVHYHLIHNRMLSLLDVPKLFADKPSVWTLHDPWALTGHCVHPLECAGWLTGCASCPHPDRWFAMSHDCASSMWAIKRQMFADLDIDLVVASEFMLDMVRRSPLTAHLERVHLIPFGVDGTSFLPDSERAASRRNLGIPDNDFVLLFRSAEGEVKGTDKLIQALAQSPPSRPTTLLALDAVGALSMLRRDHNVVELGWVDDKNIYAQAMSACDVFAMPSPAETFGLMAVEAMAAGRPVVCFEGTAVASVTHAPGCGVAVPFGDSLALREALDGLAADPSDAQRRGALGREIASREYGHDGYLDALTELYREVLAR